MFKVQVIELDIIEGLVTYSNSRQHLEALVENLSAIKSDLVPAYGMSYIIKDTLNIPNGPAAQINLTAHPGDAPEWMNGMTTRQHSNE